MPAIEDWISNPVSIVRNLFDGDSKSHADKVTSYFKERLQVPEAAVWIPSLNSTSLHNLRTNSLVRFRCMVQDMFDPEFYLGVYEVKNEASDQTRLVSGMFQDLAQCQDGERLELESPRNVTMDRQTLYCVPIPGETEWVKAAFAEQVKSCTGASTSSGSGSAKRALDEEETMEEDAKQPPVAMDASSMEATPMDSGDGEAAGAKRTKVAAESGSKDSLSVDLNFPLPGEKGPACLVKIYGNWEELRVNDMLEVVGILSNDPALARFPEDERESSFVDPAADMECAEEENVHSPPPSLVPRLHAVDVRKLQHNNPHLPADLKSEQSKEVTSSIASEVETLHSHMLDLLTQALLGDKTAAEYLLCHLVSSVYARHDVVPVGKFGLNISGCPRNTPYAGFLHKLIAQLVTATHYLPMTLDNMNKSVFCPKKDYKANRLKSGVLQLSTNTHLVVDETAMQAGQLDTMGVRNLTALGNVMRWQKVEYDFDFHKQDFETNLAVLILSEGKSMIQSDSQVVLTPTLTVGDIEQHFSTLQTQLIAPLVDKLRSYLSLVRLMEYSLSDELQKSIEEDFVNMRKEDSKNLTIDDFHGLLVLARLLSLSRGQGVLQQETWQHAKEIEHQRKQRLRQISAPPS